MPIKIAMSAKNSGQGWLQRRNQMDEESMPTNNAPDPSHAQNIHNSPLLRLRRRGSLVCAHYIAFLFKFACPLSDSERECEWIFPTLPWVCVLDRGREKAIFSRLGVALAHLHIISRINLLSEVSRLFIAFLAHRSERVAKEAANDRMPIMLMRWPTNTNPWRIITRQIGQLEKMSERPQENDLDFAGNLRKWVGPDFFSLCGFRTHPLFYNIWRVRVAVAKIRILS